MLLTWNMHILIFQIHTYFMEITSILICHLYIPSQTALNHSCIFKYYIISLYFFTLQSFTKTIYHLTEYLLRRSVTLGGTVGEVLANCSAV